MGNERVIDHLAPTFDVDLSTTFGDTVILRRDQLPAYHLAVVCDDVASQVTEVVRGRDLLQATALHGYLARALGGQFPATCHVPMLVDQDGNRFAKRHGAAGVDALAGAGWTPEWLRGAYACLWGWTSQLAPMGMDDLAAQWQDDPLRRESIRVPDEIFDGPKAFSNRSQRP